MSRSTRSSAKQKEKVCFVTVGTTCFDDLIEMFSRKEIHDNLALLGITRCEIQIGEYSSNFLKNDLN